MEKNSDKRDSLLKMLLLAIPEAKGAAIISKKGLPVASSFTEETDEVLLCPMIAAIHFMSEQMIDECSIGSLNQVVIEAKECKLLIREFGTEQILGIVLEKGAKLELIPFKESGDVFKILISLMKEKCTNSLMFERKYLPEIFKKEVLEFNTDDGLPTLKSQVEFKLIEKQIKTEYQNKLVIFSKI